MIGTSFGFHDAAVAAIKDDQIIYASHSERYSRKKNDPWLDIQQIIEAQHAGARVNDVVYYEAPWWKWLRQFMYRHPRPEFGVREHVRNIIGPGVSVSTVQHHESHAAAGFYTSPWTEAAIIVVDAIGEFDCISIWEGRGRTMRKVWAQRYPHSLGLLYSAFTKRVGLVPNLEEYMMMGMAAYGSPKHVYNIHREFFHGGIDLPGFKLTQNVHQGIGSWTPSDGDFRSEDIAASIQMVAEMYLINLFQYTLRS